MAEGVTDFRYGDVYKHRTDGEVLMFVADGRWVVLVPMTDQEDEGLIVTDETPGWQRRNKDWEKVE